MKVNRKELLASLEAVSPGLASKEVVEQSSSFVFRSGKVMTYNDAISVVASVSLEFEGAVRADELHALLKKYTADELDIEPGDTELKIKGRGSRAGIAIDTEISLPIDAIPEPKRMRTLPEDFLDSIEACLTSVSTDVGKETLCCIYLDGEIAESTDGIRLTQFEYQKPLFKKPCLLPATAAKELIKYKPERYGTAEGWIVFDCEGGARFRARLHEGKFPDTSKIIDFEGEEVTLPEKIAEMIGRARVFSESTGFEEDNKIQVEIADNKIRIEGRGPGGWVKESCKIEYSGKAVAFTVNPRLFSDAAALGHAVKVNPDEGRLRIEGNNTIHILMLMKAAG